ncbi:hypothetical protein LCGC14_2124420 [marine sediment metagenome]|uniref:LamG domain-containing protein n=1 Tax=marine sediment metagenome TaxID=412755 RepID=A0A0F9GGD3_9ZZZZ
MPIIKLTQGQTLPTFALLDQILTVLGSTKTSLWPIVESTGSIIRTYGEAAHIFTMTDGGTGGFLPAQHVGMIQSYHFDETDSQHGAGEDHADFSFAGGTDAAFSVGAWVNRDVAGAEQAILAKYDVAGTLREWKFGITSGNKVQLELFDESIADANAAVQAPGATSLTLNTWQFVVATYGGEGGAPGFSGSSMTMVIYLDGAADTGTVAGTGTDAYEDMEDTATPVMLGAADDTAGATIEMDGRIALPFITGKALSAAEVVTIQGIGKTLLGLA